MKKPFNTDNYCHFVLLPEVQYEKDQDGQIRERTGTLSFSSYTDHTGAFGNQGAGVMYVQTKDKFNRDKGKVFSINSSRNAFVVHKGDKDMYQKSMFDFLSNSPFCEGSPNGDYLETPEGRIQVNVKYRLMDSAADAARALEATTRRSRAQLSAVEIDEQTLLEVAAIGIGFHGEPDDLMRHKVSEWAGRQPDSYFEVLESGDRLYRALVRVAISSGIFRTQGPMIYWNNLMVGTDEDGAVKHLIDNPDTLAALKEKVDLKVPEKKKGVAKKTK